MIFAFALKIVALLLAFAGGLAAREASLKVQKGESWNIAWDVSISWIACILSVVFAWVSF
jgi:hypothetical protein